MFSGLQFNTVVFTVCK